MIYVGLECTVNDNGMLEDSRITDLFAGADTPIDLVNQISTDHFEKDETCTGIQHLFVRRAVTFIFHICSGTGTFPIYADSHDVWCIDFSKPGRISLRQRG